MPAKSEKAYIAGLFDGEGHVTIRRSNKYKNFGIGVSYRICIGITNRDILVLEWIKSLYGGKIYKKISKNLNANIAYEWSLHQKDILKIFFKDINKFLRIKNSQIKLAQDFIKLGNMKKEGIWPIFKALPEEINLRENFKNRLTILNQRGVKNVSCDK